MPSLHWTFINWRTGSWKILSRSYIHVGLQRREINVESDTVVRVEGNHAGGSIYSRLLEYSANIDPIWASSKKSSYYIKQIFCNKFQKSFVVRTKEYFSAQ